MASGSIYDVIKPVHICSQFIGLTSFSIKQDNFLNYEAYFTVYSVLLLFFSSAWNIFYFSQYIFSEVVPVWDFTDLSANYSSEFFERCSITVLLFFMISFMLINYWIILIKDKIVQFLQLIDEVDRMLKELDITINHKRHQKFLIVLMVLLKVYNFSSAGMSIVIGKISGAFNVSFMSSFGEIFGYESFSMLSLQFILIMWAVYKRYQLANRFLMKIYSQKLLKVETIPSLKVENLNKISILHDKLVDVTKLISFCYGVPVSKFITKVFTILKFFTPLTDYVHHWVLLCIHNSLNLYHI